MRVARPYHNLGLHHRCQNTFKHWGLGHLEGLMTDSHLQFSGPHTWSLNGYIEVLNHGSVITYHGGAIIHISVEWQLPGEVAVLGLCCVFLIRLSALLYYPFLQTPGWQRGSPIMRVFNRCFHVENRGNNSGCMYQNAEGKKSSLKNGKFFLDPSGKTHVS